MENKYQKIKQYIRLLSENRVRQVQSVEEIFTLPCDYKTNNEIPKLSAMIPYTQGEPWGTGNDTHAWFRFAVTPAFGDAYLRIETETKTGWDAVNPQFILYVNEEMVQGLDINHREYPLPCGENADVAVYAYTGPNTPSARFYADVVRRDADVEGLYYDLLYPFDALSYMDKESMGYVRTLDCLWRAVSLLDLFDFSSVAFTDSVKAARSLLEKELYGVEAGVGDAVTVGVGHTHIDCAWLWTLKQTREKVQRSFATVLALMKRYPDYKFMSSQALLYKNFKEEAPALYEELKERIKEGRWECEGAMWVEADCNLASGESLVRQILYGKNFFKREFGVDNRVLWLPDVFGYSAAMPQILRKSGIDWFVTSKISWNDTNRMPYDTFLWHGIDGSEINTQFITAQYAQRGPSITKCTYVGNTSAPMVHGTYQRYGQKNLHNEALLTYGFGDGGGGPTVEHLELAERGKRGIPGCALLKQDFVGNYLTRLKKKMEGRSDVPVWRGELYLEFHRGTYTTMARNKRWNRKSEFLYQNAELLSIITKALVAKPFPKDALHEGWEMILTNQFHDIIPGSSIKEVYDQSDRDYAYILENGEKIAREAREAICEGIDRQHGIVVFNPHSFTTRGTVVWQGKTLLTKETVPAKGYAVVNDFIDQNNVIIDGRMVETDQLRVLFDEAWQITSIYDKRAERELLKNGCTGNELRVHADHPHVYDAWEWQPYSSEEYKTVTAVTNASLAEDGIRRGIRIERPHGASVIIQTVWFYDGTPRIDFETRINWHEHHQMLKAVFPVDINADKATYDIQFGTVERPTHRNTSWDAAKFEVCAHKYADLSEGDYGVTLMNDCKYGHDIHDGVMQLSLLRSPTYPNPEADLGEHLMTYSLLLHEGALQSTDAVKQAYYLNDPMVALAAMGECDTLPLSFSAVTVDKDNVVCETVKEEENGTGTVIRLYEAKNRRTKVTLTLGIPVNEAYLCDLMENATEPLLAKNGKITLTLKPFEIVSVLVK